MTVSSLLVDRICGNGSRMLLLALIVAMAVPVQSRDIRSASRDDAVHDSESEIVESSETVSSWERLRRSSGRNEYPTGRRRMHVEIQPTTVTPSTGQDSSLLLGRWQERERLVLLV
jgi:hypothetical protein